MLNYQFVSCRGKVLFILGAQAHSIAVPICHIGAEFPGCITQNRGGVKESDTIFHATLFLSLSCLC